MEKEQSGKKALRYLRRVLIVLVLAALVYVCTGRPFYRLDELEAEEIVQARACFSVGDPVELSRAETEELAAILQEVKVCLIKFWFDPGNYVGVPTVTGEPMFQLELTDDTSVGISVLLSSDATRTVDGLSYQCDRQSAGRLWQLYYEDLLERREPYELPDHYTIYEY